ncbi:hypothetical protein AS156_16565 [Bradyrhizobium macuxiense]|uniref:Uncharacterized protein n=2 Tax=Bradyrhizobium macuxiense TaxID=1755647 RepID=A0A109JHS1_9BRAD|nr:hypothetical protein AS156_16565 [Bradyrhizobium macuxiense]
MSERPRINPGDRIKAGKIDCVVAFVHPPYLVAFSGDAEMVFNPSKPTTHDVEWNGREWVFCKRPDYGDYAEDKSRYSFAVSILRAGPKRRD